MSYVMTATLCALVSAQRLLALDVIWRVRQAQEIEARIFAREVANFFTAQFAPMVAMDGVAHLFTRILYIRPVEDCVGKALCPMECPFSLRA